MPAALADPEPIVVETPEKVRPGGPTGGGPIDFDPGGRGWWGGGDDDDSEPRRSNQQLGLLGMQFMLLSITALFITIALIYFARSQTRTNWRPIAVPKLLWLSTAVILASSVSLESARRAFRRSQAGPYARWLLVTLFLGLAFLGSQLLSLRELMQQGFYLRYNPHSSLFYVVTGVHGLHLFAGMLALSFLVFRCALHAKNLAREARSHGALVSVTVLYWHFLDALWVSLFALLVLWR